MGLRVTLVDTAGLGDARDTVEAEGVARSREARAVADVLVVVFDGSLPLDEEDRRVVRRNH